jgi:hypothetical protein
MPLEQTLPQNLDQRAHKAARRVGELNTALEYAKNARAMLHHRTNQMCAPDPSTVMALNTAVRLLMVELAEAKRLEESAARIADEAQPR